MYCTPTIMFDDVYQVVLVNSEFCSIGLPISYTQSSELLAAQPPNRIW